MTTNRNLLTPEEAAKWRTSAETKLYYQGKLDEAYEAARRQVETDPQNTWASEMNMAQILERQGNLDGALLHFQAGLDNLQSRGRWSETNQAGVRNYTRLTLTALENIKYVYETEGKMGLAARTRFEILKIMDERAEEMAAPEKLNCVDCAMIFRHFDLQYRTTPWEHSSGVCTGACEIYRNIGAYAETNKNYQLARDAWSQWAAHLSFFEFIPEAIQLREKLEPLPFDNREVENAEHCTLDLALDLAARDGVTSNVWGLVEGVLSRLAQSPHQGELLSGNLVKTELLEQEDRHGEALKQIEQVIETSRPKGYQPHLAQALKIRSRLRLSDNNLGGAEADIKEALAIYRTLGQKQIEPDLYEIYAQILGHQGRHDDAVRTWEEAYALCENLHLHFRALHMLLGLAELQLQLGQFAALDLTWQRIEKFAAGHAADFAAPTMLRLHLARLAYLKEKGEAAALAAADHAARDFVASSGLTSYQLRSFEAWTKAFPNMMAALKPRSPVTTEPTRLPELDLQPTFEITSVRTNEAAHGFFVLSNPTSEPASATLHAGSDLFQCEWETNQDGFLLVWSTNLTHGVNGRDIQIGLPPGQQCLIGTECDPLFQETNHTLTIELTGTKHPQTVHWNFGFGEDPRDLAVINASFSEDNPFYYLSLFHEVYFRGNQPLRTNMRVQASEPCRIEIVDAQTHELLAVDANGNGSFEDVGDSIATDLDLNAYPDFEVSPAADLRCFELRVFPFFKTNRTVREIQITLSFGTPGAWMPQAIDHINIK